MTRRPGTTAPTRTCVGCGSRDEQPVMIRLRRGASGGVVADGSVRVGRSAYVHARSECIHGLVRSKGLGKSLRTTVPREARMELMQVLDGRLSSGALVAPHRQQGARTEA